MSAKLYSHHKQICCTAAAFLVLAVLSACSTEEASSTVSSDTDSSDAAGSIYFSVEDDSSSEQGSTYSDEQSQNDAASLAEDLSSDTDYSSIDELIDSMTVEEKVGQMFYVRCPDEDAAADVSYYHLGGYILFGQDFSGLTADEVRSNIESYQSEADIPLLIGVDEEGGTVVRASSNTSLRDTQLLSPKDVYAQGGWDGITQDAQEKAEFLLSLGINVNMAPVCDVTTDESAFMYDRSFSGDVSEVCEFVRLYVETTEGCGLGTVLKHFPGYGDNTDTHTGIAYDYRDYSEFEEVDFLPFKEGIDAGAGAILVAHNIVYCMDEDTPASLSEEVHRVLREELGFDGVIMTDDLYMDAITDYTGAEYAAVAAVKAGNDILCCTDYETQYPAVLAAVESGEISEEQVDESVRRILAWKQSLGLLDV